MVVAPAVEPSPAERAAYTEAATYTNAGKRWLVAASEASDAQSQEMLLGSARATYLCAVRAWADALAVTTARVYETRFWLADAWNKVVRTEFILRSMARERHAAPTPTEIDVAIDAARAARDATDGSDYVDVAAKFVIEEADVARDLEYLVYEETKGAAGIAKRTFVELEGPEDERTVKVVPLPASVARSMAARDEYVRRVPAARDVAGASGVRSAVQYAFDAADVYFVYGQFAEARARFEPIYRQECGRNEYGFRAWEKLISMAAKLHDVGEARRLAEAESTHSCAVTEEQYQARDGLLPSTVCGFSDADAAFVKACGRDLRRETDQCDLVTASSATRWRTVAALYLADFERSPSFSDAPTATLRGAFAYKQVGDLGAAVALLQAFLASYDDDALLGAMESRGDARRYAERLEYGSMAYHELRNTELSRFDVTAAATADEIAARWARLGAKERRVHLLTALGLRWIAGDRTGFDALRALLGTLSPSPRERAEADYRSATFGMEAGADVRASLASFHRANQSVADALPFVFTAAWQLSRLAKASNDVALYRRWLANAQAAKEAWEKRADPDDEPLRRASAAIFDQLARELKPAHVGSTTALSAIFAPPATVGTSAEPLVP